MELKGVCFDFDGVIVNSPIAGFERVCEVFEILEIQPPTWREYFADYQAVLQRYFWECEACEPSDQQLHDWFKEYSSDIEVSFFPEVKRCIKALHTCGVPMWVVSSNSRDVIHNLLVQKHIFHLFDEVHGDVFEKSSALEAFCVKHNLTPSQVGHVDDFPVGIRAACAAGVWAIGRKTREETDAMLIADGAHLCIDSLYELLPFISTEKQNGVRYKVHVTTCPKSSRKTGKLFTVTAFDAEGVVIEEYSDTAPTFRIARKKMGKVLPGHVLASEKINKHGTTYIEAM